MLSNLINKMTPRKITFVTGNENKLREVLAILGKDFPRELEINGTDLPEYQGDADSVCIQKCLSAYEIIQGPVLVEDTCLSFNGLNGLPGPYIKWFLKSLGAEGLFRILKDYEDKSATASATFSYMDASLTTPLLFKGETKGEIVFPRGNSGFGWDSVFQPIGSSITYAQMNSDEKNAVSHRKKAVEALREHFIKNI